MNGLDWTETENWEPKEIVNETIDFIFFFACQLNRLSFVLGSTMDTVMLWEASDRFFI